LAQPAAALQHLQQALLLRQFQRLPLLLARPPLRRRLRWCCGRCDRARSFLS